MYDSNKTGMFSSDHRRSHSVVAPIALYIACCCYDPASFMTYPLFQDGLPIHNQVLGYVLAACTARGKVNQIDFAGHPVNKKTMACVRFHYRPVHIIYRSTTSLRTVTDLLLTKCERQSWSPLLMLWYSAGNASVLPQLGPPLRSESS